MKIIELTKLQKKKLLYSFLGISTIGLLIVASWFLWDNIGGLSWSEIKTRIVTSFATYLSLIFLGFKVIWFFSVELSKKMKRAKEIEEEIINIGDNMKKITKKAVNAVETKAKETEKKLEKIFETDNFKWDIISPKKIVIEAKNSFTSSHDYYKKLKAEMGNFHELLRKYLAGEIE